MSKGRAKALVMNTIIIGIGKFSTNVVSFLLLPLYTSILKTEEYGIFDLITTIATFLLPFITLLMEESMFRFLIDCNDDEEKKKIISQTMIYTLFSSIIFILIALIVNTFTPIPFLLISVLYMISSIASSLKNSLIRGLGQIKFYAIINFVASLLHIVLNVIFIAVFRYGVYGLLISGIVSNILTTIFVFIKLKMHKYFSIKGYDRKLMKEMVKYSIPLVPNSLSWAIVNLSDRLVISSVLGASANGIYSVSNKFPGIMNTVYNFFYTAWTESSARAVKDDDKEKFFNDICKLLKNVLFSISIGIIVCMPLIFNVFIKSDYSEAYMYIPILVIAMYYNNMAGYYGGIFSGYKDTKIMGKTTVVGAIINFVVDIVLVKFIGIYAAAISTLISCMFINYYREYKLKKYLKLKNNNFTFGYILLIITLILYYINNNIWIKVINLIIVIIYALYLNKEVIYTFANSIMKKRRL